MFVSFDLISIIISLYIATTSLLEKILLQQDEILKRIKALEKKEQEKEETREEKVYVPPSIRVSTCANF